MASLKKSMIAQLVQYLGRERTKDTVRKIVPFLEPGFRVVDIGAGSCDIAATLTQRGFLVTPVDIADHSVYADLQPTLYSGTTLPFADNAFDISLCSTILHHVKNPEALLREAARVSRRVIIIEDVYHSHTQKILTFIMDSVMNLEFFGHPHSNKNDAGWRNTFAVLGLEVVHASSHKFWKFFTSATYVVDKKK